MKILAYAAPTFAMVAIVGAIILFTGCATDFIRETIAPRSGISQSDNANYTILGENK